jgi:hypothetical protein
MANFFDQFDGPQPGAMADVNAQRRQASSNFFDQFGVQPSAPSFDDHFGGNVPAPQNADAVTSDLRKLATERTTGQKSSAASQIATDFMNQGSAASQGTTPNISAQQPNLISTETTIDELGNILYRDPQTGQLVQTDSSKQVALRDPADGIIKVYARTDSNNEGVLSSAGRLLMMGLATGAPVSRGTSIAPQAFEAAAKPGKEAVSAAGRLSETVGFPVNVPRAIASDSTSVQRIGQGIRNIPIVGDAIPRATQQLADDLGGAVQRVAGEFGQGSGPNVANRIGNTIGYAAQQETRAAVDSARRSDEAVSAAFEQAQRNGAQALDATDQRALQSAIQAVGDMSPQDMGQAITARLRSGEQAARARKEQLYGIAGNSDGAISAEAVNDVRARVAQSLENDGRVIDGVLTPASSRMMDELQRFASLNIENRAVGTRLPSPAGETPVRVAVSMQGVEQVRKRLNGLSRAATNDADRSAARSIVREFDNWLGDAFDNALFSGSDDALNSFRAARAANAEWRTRFGFNARDDADRVVNRIVTGDVTSQEVSNWLIGAGKVGSKGVSSRLLTRIAEATGNDPEAMQAIRGGIWNRLSQSTGGVDAKAGAKVANEINEFLNGSGRDVANRLFTPEQRGVMSAYADTLRRTESGRERLAEAGRITKPTSIEVGIGPMQEMANTVLGRGGRTDEALFSAINAYAKSGSRGDVHTLAQLVKAIPAEDRGDLAGAIIRQVGISPQTGQFSPDVFASQWRTYSPQAKAILFGNAGPHRQALDDIMLISDRLKQVGSRFGNPSGTAQNTNMFAMGAGMLAAPLTSLAAATGGVMAARLLSAPAGAASAAKWTRAYSALAIAPSAQRLAAFEIASRNLANTANSLGGNLSSSDFIRAVQGSVQGRASDEQPEPERVIYH